MTKKRILYIENNTDGTVGGSHFSLLFLIEGLNKDRYEPYVGFYQDNYLISRYKEAGCKVIMMEKCNALKISETFPILKSFAKYALPNLLIMAPLKILQKAINYFITFVFPSFKCRSILKKYKIDLIHLNNTLSRPQEWILASRFTDTKVIAHERGINVIFPHQSLFWARYISAIVCISGAVKSNLLRKGFPENKLFKIYNGLDPEKFLVYRSKDDVLREFGIANSVPVIGIVGNIKEWKGQETVIRAMKYVRSRYPGIRCLVVGGVSESDMYYRNRLRDLVKRENLGENVIFTGPRKDVPDLVNCMTILIHASIEPEPFGRTLLEGMALKKPIISTHIGAPLEIVIDGKTGILVSPGKHEEMAEAILKILSNPNLTEMMGNAGHDRLLRDFSLKNNVELTENLYAEVLI